MSIDLNDLENLNPWPPFFGEPWPSGVCDSGYQIDTPVGKKCSMCNEVIVQGDRGQALPYYGKDIDPDLRLDGYKHIFTAVHRECMARNIVGGIEHLMAPKGHDIGTCYHESTLTYRESALAAWDWIAKNGFPNE